MNLVSDARNWWKWTSVHALAVAGVLPGVWCSLPGEWRAAVPISYIAVATAITSGLGVIGRISVQNLDRTPPATHEDHSC